MQYDVIVIGGGASGMMAAGTAGSMGKKVLLLEKNEKLGKKVYITGKGRCNITNTASLDDFLKNVSRNHKFLYSALSTFSNYDTVSLLKSLGLKTKVERGNRVYPVSDKSSDVIKHFEKYMRQNNVEIRLNSKVASTIIENNNIAGIKLNDGTVINAQSVIIATGGLSYPSTGSDGDGYRFAQSSGHKIIEQTPSLVPLEVKEEYIKDLQGLSLKNVTVTLKADDKILYKDFGEMLFTHFGLSGPLILSVSYYAVEALKKGRKANIEIDLKPYMTDEELDKRLLKDFDLYTNKQFKNSLNDLLPQKIISTIINLSGISESKAVNQISKEERQNLIHVLKNLTFEIAKPRPIAEAIVTAGGVSVKEINPKTMESKLIKGLHFAGEVIDVHGFTGGYNLQIAFSTGYTAGYNA